MDRETETKELAEMARRESSEQTREVRRWLLFRQSDDLDVPSSYNVSSLPAATFRGHYGDRFQFIEVIDAQAVDELVEAARPIAQMYDPDADAYGGATIADFRRLHEAIASFTPTPEVQGTGRHMPTCNDANCSGCLPDPPTPKTEPTSGPGWPD